MNEPRLRLLDSLLRKGWHSYLDIAKAIQAAILAESKAEGGNKNAGKSNGGKVKDYGVTPFVTNGIDYLMRSYNKQLVEKYRSTIGQDMMDIPEIWALANDNHYLNRTIKRNKGEDSKKFEAEKAYRDKITKQLIEVDLRPQYTSARSDPDMRTAKGEVDIGKVKFYRYRDPGYSVFSSGDYKKYNERKAKLVAKSAISRVTKTSVNRIDIKHAQLSPDLIPDEQVSDMIKRGIVLLPELEGFEQECKGIMVKLQSKIATEKDTKLRGWIKRTIDAYKNILELSNHPLSKLDRRRLAGYIHDFAFFLASENQYNLLDERFEDAIAVYQKLLLEQRHSLADFNAGEEGFDAKEFDPQAVQLQMEQDRAAVADALQNLARVRFDSGDIQSAAGLLDKALNMAGDNDGCRARILHLRAVINATRGDIAAATADINNAYECALAAGLEKDALLEIIMSRAELRQAIGESADALTLYAEAISYYRETGALEGLATALMSTSLIHLFNGDTNLADSEIAEALPCLESLYGKEPDRLLPNLLSAKYIKMLVLSHQGRIEEAIACGQEILAKYDKAKAPVQALCRQEAEQTRFFLKDSCNYTY